MFLFLFQYLESVRGHSSCMMGRTVLPPLLTGVNPVSTGREATLLGGVGAGGGDGVVGVVAPLPRYSWLRRRSFKAWVVCVSSVIFWPPMVSFSSFCLSRSSILCLKTHSLHSWEAVAKTDADNFLVQVQQVRVGILSTWIVSKEESEWTSWRAGFTLQLYRG